MANGKIELKVSEEDFGVAYVSLSAHPVGGVAVGCAKQTIRLADVAPQISGADIYLDLNADGELIGIEILES